ncbi:MAG TPA: ATP-binding protein [bacterium]|nr:ATP-binding protein [bacterium]
MMGIGNRKEDFEEAKKSLRHRVELSASSEEPEEVPCPFCDGYGNVIDERGARPCRCVQTNRYENSVQSKLKSLSGQVLTCHHEAIWNPEKLKRRKAIEHVEEFLKGISKRKAEPGFGKSGLVAEHGLVLCGQTGVGKTMAGIYALAQIARRWPWAQILLRLNSTKLVNEFTFGGDGKFAEKRFGLIDDIESADVLLIDDIARDKSMISSDEKMANLLYTILDRAMGDRVPTILIVNMPRKEFEDFLGNDASRSRFRDPFWKVVHLVGGDLRQVP